MYLRLEIKVKTSSPNGPKKLRGNVLSIYLIMLFSRPHMKLNHFGTKVTGKQPPLLCKSAPKQTPDQHWWPSLNVTLRFGKNADDIHDPSPHLKAFVLQSKLRAGAAESLNHQISTELDRLEFYCTYYQVTFILILTVCCLLKTERPFRSWPLVRHFTVECFHGCPPLQHESHMHMLLRLFCVWDSIRWGLSK